MNQTNKPQSRGYIDLTKDLAFKSYFKGSNKILISLLNQFLPLNQKIQSVEILDSNLSSNKKKKNPILDLRVRLDNNTTVNVEMQSISKKNFTERILFYLCKLYTWNLKSGEDYTKIHPAYSLVFTNFTVFEEFSDYYSIFEWRSKKHPQVLFSRSMGIIVVELNKFKKEDVKSFDMKEMWCYLIKNAKKITKRELSLISERGSEMKEAAVRITKLSKEESELWEEEAIEKNRRDRVAELDFARDEGLEMGMLKGMEAGRAEGMVKGVSLTALNMLKENIDIHVISKVTGLTVEKIEKLKNES